MNTNIDSPKKYGGRIQAHVKHIHQTHLMVSLCFLSPGAFL